MRCLAERENCCSERVGSAGGGLGYDGGLAEYMLIVAILALLVVSRSLADILIGLIGTGAAFISAYLRAASSPSSPSLC